MGIPTRIPLSSVRVGDTVRLYTALNVDTVVTAVEQTPGGFRIAVDDGSCHDLDPASATDFVYLVAR